MKYFVGLALCATTWTSVLASTATLRMGLLHPAYRTTGAYDGGGKHAFGRFLIHVFLLKFLSLFPGHNRLAGAIMAINEINDKSDGFEDDLLPSTTIEFEWLDSARR